MASTIRTIQPLFTSLSQFGKSKIVYRRTAGVKVDILYLAICYALFVQSQMKAALESGCGKVGSRQSRSSLNYNRFEIICLHLWSVYDTVQPAQFSDWTVKGSEVYLQSHATFRLEDDCPCLWIRITCAYDLTPEAVGKFDWQCAWQPLRPERRAWLPYTTPALQSYCRIKRAFIMQPKYWNLR